ncbi:hypothetical protein ABZ807_31305 [Micromonospora sp. NPDC047548]|uniref:hypothetical protein n=1 Tax=Micromonospora sp. NPDC047548 TaxID=3155624 RepID=UPI00340DB783
MIASPPSLRSWRVRALIASAIAVTACLGVPAGWAVVKTLDAGKGEPTPVAAANAYLLAVFSGSDDELGIRRCLCSGQEAELLAEAREWRSKVAAANSEIKVTSSDWKTLVRQPPLGV